MDFRRDGLQADLTKIDTIEPAGGEYSTRSTRSISMQTRFCERVGVELPIIQAPMGGAAGPALAAAVSNAGGLGMLVPWRADLDTVRRQIREIRALTARPFGVNLNLEFPQQERLEVCLEE